MTRPLSVLHTRVVTGSGGGPDKTVLRSAAYLPSDRFSVAAAYLHPAGDPGIARLSDQARTHGMPLFTIPERGAIDRRAIHHLTDLCRRRRVDLWHSHDYKTDVLGRLVRRRLPNLKLVSTVHGFTRENLKMRLYARLNDAALSGFDHVFAVSPALLRHCAMHGVHPDRLSYLPNAIELEHYPQRTHATQQAARRRYRIAGDSPAIAVLGRLSREKGVDRAVQLFAKLRHDRPGATLHLIGDGPERGRLEQQAEVLGISEAVTFHGWCTEPTSRLTAMDALLLTSHTEGMPNAVLEAMALGVPVAATAVGGVPEMLAGGDAGVLLAGDDVAAWAGPVASLLSPSPQRAAMTLNARQRVETHYAFDARMRRVCESYETLFASSPNAHGRVA